jgi:hypothetical protein
MRLNAPTPFTDVVDVLLKRMDEVVGRYPTHVPRIPPDKIAGTAFFPGGRGLYLEGRDSHGVEFPFTGAMLLGHNFDSELGFKESFENGKEALSKGTWGPLLRLLKAAAVPLEECFFTNLAFMGLCAGENSRDYSGREDQEFPNACLSFLRTQIETQRPRFILTLGFARTATTCTCVFRSRGMERSLQASKLQSRTATEG